MNTMCSAAWALLWVVSTAGPADEYKIKLDRLPKAGDVVEVSATLEDSSTWRGVINRSPSRRAASVVVQVFIDQVDAKGRATKARIKLVKFPGELAGKTFSIIAADDGRSYVKEVGPDTSTSVDDVTDSMLDLAVPLRFLCEPLLDEMFGSADAHKKGDSWEADPKTVTQYLTGLNVKEAAKVQGKVSLKEVRGQGEKKQLLVEARVQGSGAKYDLPDGFELVEDKIELLHQSVVSPDESLLPIGHSVRVLWNFTWKNKKGLAGQQILRSVTAHYRYVKGA